jgi:hypothetical protein
MSFHFNPKLVTDGLLWAVDAANNASYNGTTNTWNDLTVNNQNLTLLSGSGAVKSLPVYNSNNLGSFFFNWTGSTSYMSGSYAINTGQNFSVFAWVYPTIGLTGTTATTISRGMILNTSYAYRSGFKDGWTIGLGASNIASADSQHYSFYFTTGRNANGSDDANYKVVTTGSLLNQWNYMGATVANSANATGDMLLYRNGRNITHNVQRAQIFTPISYSFATTTLGARYNFSPFPDWFPGNIAAAHIYNRVLTPQEVSQNYNAYKARFGLI